MFLETVNSSVELKMARVAISRPDENLAFISFRKKTVGTLLVSDDGCCTPAEALSSLSPYLQNSEQRHGRDTDL